MKKFSVILLIAVLAIGCVFAETAEATVGITGSATASYTVDFDEKTGTYDPDDSTVYASFEVAGATKATEGTGLWGEISAELKFAANEESRQYAIHTEDKSDKWLDIWPSITLKTLKIHWNEVFTVDLMKAKKIGNFATCALDTTTVKVKYDEGAVKKATTYSYDNTEKFADENGITFDWNGFSFVGAADANWGAKTGTFYFGAQTPEFAFSAFTMQGAGGFKYNRAAGPVDAWLISGSLKFGATTDAIKVTVATDQAVKAGKYYAEDVKYNADVALNAVFGKAFATLDAYYATEAQRKTTEAKVNNLLSAKVAFDLNEFNAPLTVNVAVLNMINAAALNVDATLTLAEVHTLGVYGKDLLNKATGREIGVNSTLVFEPVTINLSVFAGIPGAKATRAADYVAAEKYVGYTAGAEYENKYFTASLSVENDFCYEDPKLADLFITAGIEADGTVIENATLGFAYESGNLLDKGFGAITASCEIAF